MQELVKAMDFVHDVLFPIIVIFLGVSLLLITLFFYKKGTIFFGVILPIPIKIKKGKSPVDFRILLISCIICSVIVIIAGVSMLFGMWS